MTKAKPSFSELQKLNTMHKSFCAIVIVQFLGWFPSFSQINPGTLVVRPKEIDYVLINPGIGFTTFQRFNGDTLTTLKNKSGWTEGQPIVYQASKGNLTNKQHPQTSIAYWRVYWKYIEPEKGNIAGISLTRP